TGSDLHNPKPVAIGIAAGFLLGEKVAIAYALVENRQLLLLCRMLAAGMAGSAFKGNITTQPWETMRIGRTALL
ncbi:MAG: hypothetical protein KDA42_09210, partial [Planctomycetales bacterium]|nr:hypothetical protein [Planctomycetales bacterium]